MQDNKGVDFSFDKFKGKVVYGVNVASACGYTDSGYKLINQLCELKKGGADVEVALFPCNQFGLQESGTDSEIAGFCSAKGVEGATLFAKADVNGEGTRPTYKTLKESGALPKKITWNFAGKFIIDKEGNSFPVNEKTIVADVIKLSKAQFNVLYCNVYIYN